MLTEFEIGMGVMWFNESDRIRRGVVLDNNGSLEVVPVFAAGHGIKCYDEGGADPIKDRHNVRLKDSPPPFSLLCAVKNCGCYAMAGPSDTIRFNDDAIEHFGVSVIDDGIKVSDRDMADIRDHIWRDERQMNKRPDAGVVRLSDRDDKMQTPGSALSRLLATIHDHNEDESDHDGPEF